MEPLAQEIFRSLEDGIFVIDPQGKVLFQNEAATQLFAVAPPVWRQKCHDMLLQALHTEERMVETVTSEERCWNLIATPISQGAFLLLQDKTADYRAIEREKEFIVYAAHELRTPFTVVRGFAETLQDFPDLIKKTRQEIVGKMVHTCSRLDRMLKSLLTLADVEALSEERFSVFDLKVVVEECVDFLLTLYPGLDVQILPNPSQEPFLMRGERELIFLTVMNILENSVRYSTPPAHIRLSLQEQGSDWALSIQDRGIGISASDLPRIFHRFYTVDKERSRKSGGAGLGLSIVRAVLNKHKGEIQVHSDYGKGSVFTLLFPAYSQALSR